MSLDEFLRNYPAPIPERILKLRMLLLTLLPDVEEVLDLPAKMIAYSYGRKYIQMVCTIIPSQKGIKLGFYKGNELPDPAGILQGNGKISRYVEVKGDKQIEAAEIRDLILTAYAAYLQRMETQRPTSKH